MYAQGYPYVCPRISLCMPKDIFVYPCVCQYVYAGGKVFPGLVTRRNKEKDLFLDCRMAQIKDVCNLGYVNATEL
jgi:hypothetical protein